MQDRNEEIRRQFMLLRQAGKARHRDIAESLEISEGALIAAHVGEAGAGFQLRATRLEPLWPELVEAIEALGEVMALTRNASCVHEKTGVYRKASHKDGIGLVLGEIDLRIFYRHWAHGFAVAETTDKGLQQSLQFFDASGTAVHKIFLRPQSDAQAHADLVERFAASVQQPGLEPAKPMSAPGELRGEKTEAKTETDGKTDEKADASIDVAGFRAAWRELRDTHEFFGLLKKFGVSRTQGLRLADPVYATQVGAESVRKLLNTASLVRIPIMVFVGNSGVIQIHTGEVSRIEVMGPWLNVLDPRFNLHLRQDHIASAWVVRKPTTDGLVTSLELFDAAGDVIAMLFGERKPGKPELDTWRAAIEGLVEESVPCAA